MIRPATLEDLPELVSFSFECQESMPWREHGLGGNVDSVAATIRELIASPGALLDVVELHGRIEGACAVALQGYLWNRGVIIASELIWHMRPSFPEGPAKGRWVLRMLDHMRSWARRRGAGVFKVDVSNGDVNLMAALARRGLTPYETACVGAP